VLIRARERAEAVGPIESGLLPASAESELRSAAGRLVPAALRFRPDEREDVPEELVERILTVRRSDRLRLAHALTGLAASPLLALSIGF
jgi:hypothetical protein